MSVRAAVINAPGRFSLETFPDPDPGPGAVVLRMEHSGICGTDKHTWRGESKQYAGTDHERDAAYPLICGHENVGVIEAIGPHSIWILPISVETPTGTVCESGVEVSVSAIRKSL